METDSRISLEGSTSVVIDFFECSVNSILYLRNIYPEEDFCLTKKYGIDMYMSTNEEFQSYIEQVKDQLRVWLNANKIRKLVLVFKSVDRGETLERWQFDILADTSKTLPDGASSQLMPPPRTGLETTRSVSSDLEPVKELRAIMRQINSSVSFLPIFTEPCTYNVLVYADEDIEVPTTWADSDPNLIRGGGEHVRFNSFSTSVHKVDAIVAYLPTDRYDC